MGMDNDEIRKKSRITDGDDIAHDIDDLGGSADELLDEYGEDQDWEADDPEEEELEEPAPRRKKGLFSFNTIVITIAVVFGGAFIAMQLAKHAPKQQQTATTNQQTASTGLQMVGEKEREEFNRIDDSVIAPGLPPESSAEGARQGAGLPLPKDNMPPMPGTPDVEEAKKAQGTPPESLPEPGIMADASSQSAAEPRSVPSLPVTSEAEAPGLDLPAEGSGKIAGDVLTPMPDLSRAADAQTKQPEKSIPPLPKADDIFKAPDKKPAMPSSPVRKVETQNLDETLPDAMPSPPVESVQGKNISGDEKISSADISGLEARLSELGDRLNSLEEKIGKSSASESEGQEIKALKETVQRLESKLSSLSSASVKAPSTVSENKPARREIRKKTQAPSTAKPAEIRASARVSEASPVTQKTSALEIRAAQPGRAWVARPGDNDLQSISVGDSLPGIGRVTSITQTGGIWVVEGTRGRISQ